MLANDRLRYLFERHLGGELSAAEKDELFQYISHAEYDEDLQQLIKDTWEKEFSLHDQDERKADIIFQKITGGGKVRKLKFWRYAAAAVIILMLGVGSYFLLNKPQKQIAEIETQQQRFKNDVAPGGNKAILTLANGKQIILDSAANGIITQEANAKITKPDSGRLVYNATGSKNEILYNTISTPKGGQYQVVLADGSKVWLNAASSLKYPTTFSGNDRVVELTGEGYFEIVHNNSMPFKVKVGTEIIEDLGTHFNINAYADEPSQKTTLLEGSVKVGDLILQPGEQASESNGKINVIKDVDLEDVVAWKEGKFRFSKVDLQSIMRQAARWYDVDVEFKGTVPETFSGGIPRNMNVSQLLKVLEYSNKVTFTIDGRKITVQPK